MPEEQTQSSELTLYLTLSGPLDDVNVTNLMQQIDPAVGDGKINHLYIMISTPGGSVNAGILLYNYLRSLPIKVTTHNIGQVDSIGNVVFLAGEERIASPATSFLFHGVSLTGNGPISFSKTLLQERLSQIEQDEKRIETIVKDRTSLTSRKLTSFFNAGKSLGPEDARTFGIIHEIKVPVIPHDAQRAVVSTFPAQN